MENFMITLLALHFKTIGKKDDLWDMVQVSRRVFCCCCCFFSWICNDQQEADKLPIYDFSPWKSPSGGRASWQRDSGDGSTDPSTQPL